MRVHRGTTVKAAWLATSSAMMAVALIQTSALGQAKPVRARAKPAPPSYARSVKPTVAKYCGRCHGGDDPVAGVSLNPFPSETAAREKTDLWNRVAANVRSGHMPPKGMPKPTPAERTALLGWIDAMSGADCTLPDPGRVTVRRLNREEYNNTVRDLLGTSLRPADDFPSDDVGHGFDNIGDVLSMSPLLMEKYLEAAERLARSTIAPTGVRTRRLDVETFRGEAASGSTDGGKIFHSMGEIERPLVVPRSGSYRLVARAWGMHAGPEAPKLVIKAAGKVVGAFDVTAKEGAAKEYETTVQLPAGTHPLGLAFINDYYNVKDPEGQRDRNLIVNYVEVTGPLEKNAPPSDAHRRLIPVDPAPGKETEAARQALARFAARAYRRPPSSEDMERLMQVYAVGAKGGSFEDGMRLAVEAALVSPRFLFRIESDPQGTKKAVRDLDDWELASRLSYFLWSSMPDDELFDLARQGKLRQPAVLAAQAARMLKDPRAGALADNFAGQWLQLRKLAIVEPDRKRFPSMSAALKSDMATETKRFFMEIAQNDRSVLEFLDAKYTFVNERLARHYGIPGVSGPEFRKVPVPAGRGGLLAQASVLTVTSNPTRTSPTKRGKWVLENLLGTPPPPPPPGVGDIKDERGRIDATTLRQLMEEHRKNPTCASCHSRMDPIGFGLENFDAVGQWRDKEGKYDVDASGKLPDGRTFRGATQLKAILMEQKGLFSKALADRLFTYALGRGLDRKDQCEIDDAAKRAAKQGYRFSSLVTSVVTSEPFRQRRAEPRTAK